MMITIGNPTEAFGCRVGDRIELTCMGDDPYPIGPGAQGTITGFCAYPGCEQVWVRWDNGRGLHLIPGDDIWVVIR